jgi:hypothetical protein
LGKPSGASEPDSLASKLADAPVSEALSRFAIGPAFRALREIKKLAKNWHLEKAWGTPGFAGMAGFLKRHLQAYL